MGQDWYFMLNAIESSISIGYMPGAYVNQYLHSNSRLSTGMSKINGENKLYNEKRNSFHY